MKNTALLLVSLLLSLATAKGQIDSASVYQKLKTKKYYSVSLFSKTVNGETVFTVNDKEVDKATYKKFNASWKNMDKCLPCILEVYDEKEVLLRKSVSYTDCGVGPFVVYFSNGKPMLKGSYLENSTGIWDNIDERGYCSVPHGKWTYFNEEGEELYSEYWEKGVFIKQSPEQEDPEIWKVEMIVDGTSLDSQSVYASRIGDIVIEPRFKNSNTNSEITLSLSISAIGYKIKKKTFTLESFKYIDVPAMLEEMGIPKEKKASFQLCTYMDGNMVDRRQLIVIR